MMRQGLCHRRVMKVQVLLPDVGALSSVVFFICCSISVGTLTNVIFILSWWFGRFVCRMIRHVYDVVWCAWRSCSVEKSDVRAARGGMCHALVCVRVCVCAGVYVTVGQHVMNVCNVCVDTVSYTHLTLPTKRIV